MRGKRKQKGFQGRRQGRQGGEHGYERPEQDYGFNDHEDIRPRGDGVRGGKKPIVVTAQTVGQKQYIIDILNNDIVICTGPAGSGKTIIPVGLALQKIMAPNPEYDKIVIVRPAMEACGESIGYLPGDVSEKLAPYAAPIIDNMSVFIDSKTIKDLFYHEKVEILPLAFCRGRSLNNSFIIVDESQNLEPKALLMLLTRLGKGSKLVFNGDMRQSDIGNSGLADAIDRLQDIDGIAFTELTAVDIVRHPLIGQILERYGDIPM